ncbi:hypothetical protein [Fibrobacter succinogenes]|uniref:hypothetical protein n=1 Tax=Fibrobacter succinogenes TaxID=833 RepID=UPI0013CF415E|nr:hypothetical protein [Fibrobacter succinogenes]
MKPYTTKIAFGGILFAVSLFTACSDSKITGTDEQSSSINALNADSTIQTWLEADTLRPNPECTNCLDTTIDIIHDLPSGIKTKNGELKHVYKTNFESVFCETTEMWFVYSVSVSDTAVIKYYDIPDTLSPESFKQDCANDGGIIAEESPLFQGRYELSCTLPAPMKTEITPGGMQYFDAHWKKYAQQIIDVCGEPIEDRESPEGDPSVIIDEEDDQKFLSENEEKLASYLHSNPLSKEIQVDNQCVETEFTYECGNNGVPLDNGIVYYTYLNIFESIRCQNYISDSLGEIEKVHSYTVSLDGNTVTKKWSEDDFNRMPAEELALAKKNFTEYCNLENGAIISDTYREITCEIKIEPLNKDDVDANGAEPFYNYSDPVWDIYGTKVIAACRYGN